MLWTTSVTFISILLVLSAIAYALTASDLPITERLTRIWRPPTAPQDSFKDRQKERLQRVLSDVGKVLPTSPQQVSRTAKLMSRAGYRRPEAITAVRGVKVALPIALLSLVYFSGIYQESPFFILLLAGVIGYLAPELWLTRQVSRRQNRIRLGLPDALDLLVICVESGLGLDQSLLRVSEELRIAHPDLSDEFDLLNAEVRMGKNRLDAFRALGTRTGVDDIKALVAMLTQTERFGTSVAQSLRVHSDDLRTKRRQRAEEMAAKTTVKMVPALVFFIFPALFVVILGPAVISLLQSFASVLGK